LSTVRRIAKNTSALLVAQVVSYLLGFFYGMYTARYLGPASLGILSFALAFTAIFAVLPDFGLQSVIMREVARDKSLAPKYRANISLMKIILVVITFGLIALTINLMDYPEETIKVVYLIGLSVIFAAFTQVFFAIFLAYESMEYLAIGQILNAALMLGGVILAIRYHFSVVAFATLYSIASLIFLGYGLAVYRLKFSNQASTSAAKIIEFDWSFWKPTIKQAFPFFLAAAFVVISFRTDIVLLSMMKGDMAVGWYSAARGLIEALLLIPGALLAAMYPVLSSFHISSQESLKLAYQKSFKYLLILGLPIAVGTTILANRIILAIYQSSFAQSITILQVLIWVVPFIFLNAMFGTVMGATNRQWLGMKVSLLCTISNVVMNIILIPRYSYIGAAIAFIVSGLVAFILYFYFLSKLVSKIPAHKLIIKPVIASGVMALFLIFFGGINLILLIPVAAIIYFAILLLLKAFSKDDFSIFKQAVGTK
jgi:O-antigen/teichoic acid export membrane protein